MRRHIEFHRLHNFRDLGGYRTADGRTVRWGRLYRSDSLAKLDGEDWRRFLGLGIRTVIDLRYPSEVARHGRVREVEGLAYHNLSVERRPYDQATLAPDVEPVRFLADRYAEIALDGVAELGRVLRVLTAGGSTPAVFHCASGKDRTGLLAALVLTLLGVGEDDVVADFALTERATSRLVADWKAAYPDRTLVWPGYGRAPAEVMRLVLTELAAAHGSVARYAADRLGAGDDLVAALRANLLEP